MGRGHLSVLHAMPSVRRYYPTFERQRRLLHFAPTILLLGLAAILGRPILLLVFPGVLLMHLPWGRQRYLSDLLPMIVGSSLAFWIVSFWFVPYLRLPLSVWAYAVIALAAFLWGIGRWARRNYALLVLDRQEVFALSLLLVASTLRYSFFWRWPLAPAGADMTMHSYIAALIVAGDSAPSSHQPLLPIDGFGAYPVGFQALTALMSLLGDLPVFRSALLMEASTLSLLTLAFYSLLRVFWDRQISAMVALLVTFLPRNPQSFIQWGGDPTLLAFALLVIVLGCLPWLKERLNPGAWGLCGLLLAASVLTHLIPVIGLLYTAIPLVVYGGIRDRAAWCGEKLHVIRNTLGIGVTSALLLAAYLHNFLSTEVSAAEVEWVRRFQQQWSGGAWGGTLGNAVVTIPHYLTEKVFGGAFLGLSCLGWLILALRWSRLAIASSILALTVLGLVVNSMYWILPLSYAIYPERVALLLLLPCALGIGALLESVRSLVAKNEIMPWIIAVLVLCVSVCENERLFYKGLVRQSLLTEADLRAMHWIRANTGPGDVFQNRYGDAGLWIPAIAFRPITDPHLSPFYFDEFRAASPSLKPSYVYVGKKKVLGEPISVQEFESRPDVYRKVYDHDGVIIYAIIGQAVNVEAGSPTELA
jgi:hypothetical protein